MNPSADSLPRVPLNDLKRGAATARDSLVAAAARVVDSGWFVLGPENSRLEQELQDYLGVAHAIGVANGTDALQLAMAALGVNAGDTVLTAANAGGYTSTATRLLGAVPVYADVDAQSHLLTPATLTQAWSQLDPKPVVVVVTHLYGRSADMPAIMAWADEHDVPVIEDCAQTLGAMTPGVPDRRAGSWGQLSTTSFYPTKNLGALGDGGAVFANDDALADRVRALRQYGWTGKYHAAVPGGMNSRLDEMQAAILRDKLPLLDGWNERRREIHRRYEEALGATEGAGVRLINRSGPDFVGHLAVLQVPDRAAAVAAFEAAGIGTDVHYPVPDHRQPVCTSAGVSLPVTEDAADHIVSIPLFPELTDSEVDRVCAVLRELRT